MKTKQIAAVDTALPIPQDISDRVAKIVCTTAANSAKNCETTPPAHLGWAEAWTTDLEKRDVEEELLRMQDDLDDLRFNFLNLMEILLESRQERECLYIDDMKDRVLNLYQKFM